MENLKMFDYFKNRRAFNLELHFERNAITTIEEYIIPVSYEVKMSDMNRFANSEKVRLEFMEVSDKERDVISDLRLKTLDDSEMIIEPGHVSFETHNKSGLWNTIMGVKERFVVVTFYIRLRPDFTKNQAIEFLHRYFG